MGEITAGGDDDGYYHARADIKSGADTGLAMRDEKRYNTNNRMEGGMAVCVISQKPWQYWKKW